MLALVPLVVGAGLAHAGTASGDPRDTVPPGPGLAGTVAPGEASEQAPASEAESAPVSADWLVPDPPALTALGDAGGAFDEPSTPSDFAVSLGDFFDENGRLQGGGAVEAGLRAVGLTRTVSAATYRRSPLVRALARTYVSAATTSSGDDVLASAGLRTVLWGGADPLLAAAYRTAIAAARAACDSLRDDPEAWGACLAEAYDREAAAIPDPAWNAGGATLALAGRWAFPGGSLPDGGADALFVRGSLALPAGPAGQVGLGLGWTERLDADEADELAAVLAGRLGVGGTRLTAELGWRATIGADDPTHTFPLTLGGQVRLDDGMWLESSAGLSFSPGDDLVAVISRATLRWGQATEPAFKAE